MLFLRIIFHKSLFWVPIGSLFQSLGVPISLGDSAYDGGRDRYAPRAVVVAQSAQLAPWMLHNAHQFWKRKNSKWKIKERKKHMSIFRMHFLTSLETSFFIFLKCFEYQLFWKPDCYV